MCIYIYDFFILIILYIMYNINTCKYFRNIYCMSVYLYIPVLILSATFKFSPVLNALFIIFSQPYLI